MSVPKFCVLRIASRQSPEKQQYLLAGVCEHGDHPAPEGERFCSNACRECEHAEPLDGFTCAGICGSLERY